MPEDTIPVAKYLPFSLMNKLPPESPEIYN